MWNRRGHARGSFTGAVADVAGFAEAAHGGTLFIDELGTASAVMQRALLQLVDRRTVQRVGERRTRQLDLRIVFATNVDLQAAVAAGTFLPDLLHRMGYFIVRMPALAEHRQDILEYVEVAVVESARTLNREPPTLSREQWDRLLGYDWPGNVRQLQEVIKFVVATGELPDVVRRSGRDHEEWAEMLVAVMARHHGNVSAAARELGISRKAVYRELKRGEV